MGSAEVTAFRAPAMDEQVAASTQKSGSQCLISLPESSKAGVGDAIDAVRAEANSLLPTVLTKRRLLPSSGNCQGVYQLVVKLLYGSGLRLTEGCPLS